MINFRLLKIKILVTGHTGFKGSWLCLWLHIIGANLWYFEKYNYKPSHYHSIFLKRKIKEFFFDLKSLKNKVHII